MGRLIAAALLALGFVAAFTAPANAYPQVVQVNRATFHHYVQDGLSPCGTGLDPTQNSYKAPVAPASVLADLDSYDGHWSVRYASPNVLTGLTGNGLPMVYFHATRPDYRYITVQGHRQQVRHYAAEWVAAVPGFAGKSCDTWTLIGYRS